MRDREGTVGPQCSQEEIQRESRLSSVASTLDISQRAARTHGLLAGRCQGNKPIGQATRAGHCVHSLPPLENPRWRDPQRVYQQGTKERVTTKPATGRSKGRSYLGRKNQMPHAPKWPVAPRKPHSGNQRTFVRS